MQFDKKRNSGKEKKSIVNLLELNLIKKILILLKI